MSEMKQPNDGVTPVSLVGLRLVILMYDGAIGALHKAIAAIEDGDIEKRCESVNMAMEILTHLCVALDFEQGGVIAASLNDLYRSMIARLVRVNLLNDPKPAREVLRILEPLYDTWRKVDEKIALGVAAHELTAEPQALRAVG